MITKYKEKLRVDNEFLADAINIVEEYYLYPKSYKDLAHIISIEFNCKCVERDIANYFKYSNSVKNKNIFNSNITVENVDLNIICVVCFDTKKVYNGIKYIDCPNCK